MWKILKRSCEFYLGSYLCGIATKKFNHITNQSIWYLINHFGIFLRLILLAVSLLDHENPFAKPWGRTGFLGILRQGFIMFNMRLTVALFWIFLCLVFKVPFISWCKALRAREGFWWSRYIDYCCIFWRFILSFI